MAREILPHPFEDQRSVKLYLDFVVNRKIVLEE